MTARRGQLGRPQDQRSANVGGSPQRLLAFVFVIAAAITAVLSLDATIVLLTPVVFATAALMRTSAKPQVYACAHLANSASHLCRIARHANPNETHADTADPQTIQRTMLPLVRETAASQPVDATGGVASPLATPTDPWPPFWPPSVPVLPGG